MSLAESQPTEPTIIDWVRFAWRSKWYILAGLALGLFLAYPATRLLPDTINRTITLTIYPSGTPTDTAEDIQAQLTALLARKSFTAVPIRGKTALTISMPYRAADIGSADGKFVILAKVVSDYRVRLLAKVTGAYFDLQQREGAEGRAETLVKFRSFQEGIKDGSIEPVDMAVTETDRREQNKAIILVALPVVGLVFGLFLAGLMSVVRRFKLFS
jgi:hypothetical protein